MQEARRSVLAAILLFVVLQWFIVGAFVQGAAEGLVRLETTQPSEYRSLAGPGTLPAVSGAE